MSFSNYLKKFEEEKGIDISEHLNLNDTKDLENSIEKAIKKADICYFWFEIR